MDSEQTPPNPKPVTMTTLGELGAQLPVGVQVGAVRSRDLIAGEFNFKTERALGSLLAKVKGRLTPSGYIGSILSQLCRHVGPNDLGAMTARERLVALGQMFVADVQYAMIWTRVQAVGGDFDVPIECNKCGDVVKATVDLNEMEIGACVGTAPVDLSIQSVLRDGFECRGKKVKSVTLEPFRWWAMDSPSLVGEERQNRTLVEGCLLASAIRALDGDPVTMTVDDLDMITTFDKQGLAMDLEDNAPGPQFAIEVECPNCGRSNSTVLNWMDPDFFKRSSRSRTSRA